MKRFREEARREGVKMVSRRYEVDIDNVLEVAQKLGKNDVSVDECSECVDVLKVLKKLEID
jgi:hypothetical protein